MHTKLTMSDVLTDPDKFILSEHYQVSQEVIDGNVGFIMVTTAVLSFIDGNVVEGRDEFPIISKNSLYDQTTARGSAYRDAIATYVDIVNNQSLRDKTFVDTLKIAYGQSFVDETGDRTPMGWDDLTKVEQDLFISQLRFILADRNESVKDAYTRFLNWASKNFVKSSLDRAISMRGLFVLGGLRPTFDALCSTYGVHFYEIEEPYVLQRDSTEAPVDDAVLSLEDVTPDCDEVIPPDVTTVAGFPQVHDLANADLTFNINCANGARVKITAETNTIEIEGDVVIKANLGDDAAPAFRWGDCTSVESPMPNRRPLTGEEILDIYGPSTDGGVQGIAHTSDATSVEVGRTVGYSAVGPDGKRIYTKDIREALSLTEPTWEIDASLIGRCIDEVSREHRLKTIIGELLVLGILPFPERVDAMTDAQRTLWNALMRQP